MRRRKVILAHRARLLYNTAIREGCLMNCGYFDDRRREYVVTRPDTPAPWTNYLGSPDYGVIACGYAGSLLLAGACVAAGTFASALTRSQVVSFVVALGLCLLLNLAGFPPVTNLFGGWAPAWLLESVAACSFLQHFETLSSGVFDFYAVAYFAAVMVFMLAAAHAVVENRKGS